MKTSYSIVMMGASGEVGGEVVKDLITKEHISMITLLGRRNIQELKNEKVEQNIIDVTLPNTYEPFISQQDVAICTLGVGQPSKVSKEDFIKIDKTAVLDFARTCKEKGVSHFQLLASVGIDENASSFYLRSKGELVKALEAMEFNRLSIFQPSMILTSKNRYGIAQGIILKLWPLLKPLFFGPMRKYRGIRSSQLGKAMSRNATTINQGAEYLVWDDFIKLTK
ncbi:NAD(P)H-binding protein [Saprospiraceae bacterium]|nr:NAD(P)H-binding protein [Saprospiraceae bacterium]